jgi:hypothetical protein
MHALEESDRTIVPMNQSNKEDWADDPYYPEKAASLAIRIGVNYVVYSMTH